MNLPRVVATDLDGTLLRSDGTLSPRTRATLVAAAEAGVLVVFVTARPPRWLPALGDAVGDHGTVICLGGACVLELATGRVLEETPFARETLVGLLADLRAAVPGVTLGLERVVGPLFDPGYPARPDLDGPQAPRGDLAAAVRTGPTVAKLVARLPGSTGQDDDRATAHLHATVRRAAGDRAVLADSGAPGLAELLPPGVSKAGTLARWCAARGVDAADVWAFGDAPNDLPMLAWAARSFAVAEAHPAVREACTDVTASNDDDGVARALEAALAT